MEILVSFGMVGMVQWLIILFVVLIGLLLPLIALIDILRHEFTGSNKIVWVIVVLIFPFFGAILYFIIGSGQKVR
jgi:hypothetical protein